ncbi:DUF998 domain-containing protein [Intestinibacter sp.]
MLSYAASVFFSPLAYPGYNWMSMAVSELSATDAPSRALAIKLNCLYGPCGILCIMAVCVAAYNFKSKPFRVGIFLFAAMEWVTSIGYELFPFVSNAEGFNFQNMMHIAVTVAVVGLSISSLVLIAIGAGKDKFKGISVWAIVCLVAMIGGAIGTGILPKSVFGIAERVSTFSVGVFNAVLGVYLLRGKFDKKVDYKEEDMPQRIHL